MEENKIIIYNTDDGKSLVKLFAKDGTVWLNQKLMAELFTSIGSPAKVCVCKMSVES